MFSQLDIKIIKALQEDLPLTEEPFKVIAEQLGISEEELLEKISYFLEEGYLRRFGATIRHRKAGFAANAMIVWDVEDDRAQDAGKKLALFPEVSHCYQRPRHTGWPFNIFTMVHGRSKEQCQEIANKMAEQIQVFKFDLLFSTEELKKTSMKYFS